MRPDSRGADTPAADAAGAAQAGAWGALTCRAGGCLARALAGLGRLLLPGECALCGGAAGGALACAPCRRQYIEMWRAGCGSAAEGMGQAATAGPACLRCRLCAHPLPVAGNPVCAPCLSARPAFDATYTVADYALPLDRLVLQLKFGGRLALARLCGEALADVALATPGFQRPDLLCPVPLGPRRLAQRGYNQALEIARPLARRLHVPLQARLAVRIRETDAQSLKGPEARRANIAGAFAIPDRRRVEGRHIGVVDDVMTTGATMQELAALLRRYGAARVTCLVFARTALHEP